MLETLLSQIRQLVTVDVDSMDPAHAARHTSPEKGLLFCDMTSNQAILGGQAERLENRDLVKEAIQEVKASYEASGEKKQGEEFAMDVIDVLVRFSAWSCVDCNKINTCYLDSARCEACLSISKRECARTDFSLCGVRYRQDRCSCYKTCWVVRKAWNSKVR